MTGAARARVPVAAVADATASLPQAGCFAPGLRVGLGLGLGLGVRLRLGLRLRFGVRLRLLLQRTSVLRRQRRALPKMSADNQKARFSGEQAPKQIEEVCVHHRPTQPAARLVRSVAMPRRYGRRQCWSRVCRSTPPRPQGRCPAGQRRCASGCDLWVPWIPWPCDLRCAGYSARASGARIGLPVPAPAPVTAPVPVRARARARVRLSPAQSPQNHHKSYACRQMAHHPASTASAGRPSPCC